MSFVIFILMLFCKGENYQNIEYLYRRCCTSRLQESSLHFKKEALLNQGFFIPYFPVVHQHELFYRRQETLHQIWGISVSITAYIILLVLRSSVCRADQIAFLITLTEVIMLSSSSSKKVPRYSCSSSGMWVLGNTSMDLIWLPQRLRVVRV